MTDLLSLIIPTYNRSHLLHRLLLYYKQQQFRAKIIVADSSIASVIQVNQKIVDSLSNVLNIHHQQYDSKIHSFVKLAKALETVDSKYVVFCADDDFVSPPAMEECARFLENHSDYVIAHGCSTIVTPIKGKLQIGNDVDYSIEDPNPQQRLQKHLINYKATFYSIHHRSDLKRNLEITIRSLNLVEQKISTYLFCELTLSCLSLIQGKSKCLNLLYIIRTYPPDAESRKFSVPGEITSDDFSQRYNQFAQPLTEELAKVAGISLGQSKDIVNEAFVGYLAYSALPLWFPSPKPKQYEMVSHQWIEKLADAKSHFYRSFQPISEWIVRYPDGVVSDWENCQKYLNLGKNLVKQGLLDEALTNFQTALAIQPNLAEVHTNIAAVLHQQHQWQDAIHGCQKAIALNPNLAEAYFTLGSILTAQGKLNAAMRSYHQTIQLAPEWEEASFQLELLKNRIGLADEL